MDQFLRIIYQLLFYTILITYDTYPHIYQTSLLQHTIHDSDSFFLLSGADTRATAGPIVADKNCEKIHYIAPNIYCCGAGVC